MNYRLLENIITVQLWSQKEKMINSSYSLLEKWKWKLKI